MGKFLGRPKQFVLHNDAHQYYPDIGALKTTIERVRDQDIEAVNAAFGQAWYPVPSARRLYRKHKAKFNDPICVYAVLEMCIQSQVGTYLRPEYLLDILSREYPLYYWDAGGVGRMMSGLYATCGGEYIDAPAHQLPFDKGRDARGKYYVVDPVGGDEGRLWLLRCRNIVLEKATALMARQLVGDFAEPDAGLVQPGNLYGEWFADTRIRDAQNYIAQMRPGEVRAPSVARVRAMYANDPLA
jgi:hypothetical protein